MARPSRSAERRSEIFAAYESCVILRGFEKTTLMDVAEAAGQSRALVRHYLGNRDEMMRALIERMLERAQHQIDALRPEGNLDQIATLLMDTVFDDPRTNIVIMELWHVALRDAGLRAALAAIYGSYILRVAEMLSPQPTPEIHQQAFEAVALAFGAGFFRYLGLAPPQAGRLDDAVRALLGEKVPVSEAKGVDA